MEARREHIRAWKPRVPGVREVFHARFVDHAYPAHTHDTWTVFIVDDGGIRYDLGRHARWASPRTVYVLPPGVVHDGRPASGHGFTKRVLYLEPEVLGERLAGAAVDQPAIADPHLMARLAAVHEVLDCADDALEAETRLAFIAERLRASLSSADPVPPVAAGNDLAEHLRAVLDANLFEPITLAEAAAEVGASPVHIARSFVATFGIAPHAYLLGRRIERSREQLLEGQPVARVAADMGFCDQAHFTRAFKRHLGVPPGRYVASASGGRDLGRRPPLA